MANPTTNFGWVMPTSSSLVTNLPADFNTFGQAVDTSMAELKGGTTGQILSKTSATDMDFTWITNDVGDITAVTAGTGISGGGTSGAVTITNSMATEITASGDMIVGTGSGTFDNLPIGTTGQVLTADTTVSPYKVKWAAASAGALTKITSGSFSNVATVDIDSVFSSTYKNYMVVLRTTAATPANDLQLQYRVSSTTSTGANYYGSLYQYDRGNTLTTAGFAATTSATLATDAGDTTNGYRTSLTLYFTNVGISSAAPAFWGQGINNTSNQAAFNTSGIYFGTDTNTGFRLKSSSSNISGDYAVYGLAD